MNTVKLAILALVLTFSGCGPSLHLGEMADENSSLVFGYINVKCMSWVQLRKAGADTDSSYVTTKRVEDGLFYAENIEAGSYQILRFGCGGIPIGKEGVMYGNTGATVFRFPENERNETSVRISKPGVYFMGAFKYHEVKTGMFENEKFNIDKSDSPSQRQLLDRVEKFAIDTKWDKMIRKKLQEVK